MRKLWKGLLALSLCVPLTACSKDSNENQTDVNDTCELLESAVIHFEKVDLNIETKNTEKIDFYDIKENTVFYGVNNYYDIHNNGNQYGLLCSYNLNTNEESLVQESYNIETEDLDYNFYTADAIMTDQNIPLYNYIEANGEQLIYHLMYGNEELLTVQSPGFIQLLNSSESIYVVVSTEENDSDKFLSTWYKFDGELEAVRYETIPLYYYIWNSTDGKLVYRKESFENDGQSLFYEKDGEFKSFYVPYSPEPYFIGDSTSSIGGEATQVDPICDYYFSAVIGDYITTVQKIGEDEVEQVVCNMDTGIKTPVKIMYYYNGELTEKRGALTQIFPSEVLSIGNNMFVFVHNSRFYKGIIDEENQMIIYTIMDDTDLQLDQTFIQYFNNNDGSYYCLCNNEMISYDDNNNMTKEGSLDLYHITVDFNK